MSIKRDLTDLPKGDQRAGLLPDPEPRFVHLLAQKLATRPSKPTRLGTRMRFSDAGKCARYLSLKVAGFTPEPMDLAGHHVTNLGTLVHEAWQEAVAEVYPDAQIEPAGMIEECDASGSADLVVEVEGKRILVELKTTGGFGYKLMVGERGTAEGPRDSYMVQAALNAHAHDCDEAVIAVLSNEAISKGAAARKGIDEVSRFAAEWTLTRKQIDDLAYAEIARQAEILRLVESGKLAPRHIPFEMPSGARIVDTDKGRWELRRDEQVIDTGSTWQCQYCSQKDNCDLYADADTPEFEAPGEEAVA